MSGDGKIKYFNGDIFEGMMKDNQPLTGKWFYESGDKYVGSFKDWKFEGEGKITFVSNPNIKSYSG